jgi:hypothetical protein
MRIRNPVELKMAAGGDRNKFSNYRRKMVGFEETRDLRVEIDRMIGRPGDRPDASAGMEG